MGLRPRAREARARSSANNNNNNNNNTLLLGNFHHITVVFRKVLTYIKSTIKIRQYTVKLKMPRNKNIIISEP